MFQIGRYSKAQLNTLSVVGKVMYILENTLLNSSSCFMIAFPGTVENFQKYNSTRCTYRTSYIKRTITDAGLTNYKELKRLAPVTEMSGETAGKRIINFRVMTTKKKKKYTLLYSVKIKQ